MNSRRIFICCLVLTFGYNYSKPEPFSCEMLSKKNLTACTKFILEMSFLRNPFNSFHKGNQSEAG